MRFPLALFVFLLLPMFDAPPATAQAGSQGKRNEAAQTFTGCLDQRDAHYYLTEETELKPVARLRAEGATEDDWFAKHVGHRVRISGKASERDGARFIHVRRIQTIAETCQPR